MKIIKIWKQYQFLFEELVKRDFTKKYKRTVLGMLWSVLSPLMTLLVMRVVFTKFFGRSIPHYTTYLFTGNLVFSYFRESTTNGMSALISNREIFSKVPIPKYMFVLSNNASSLLNFFLTFIVFIVFVLIDGLPITWNFLLLIFATLCLLVFNVGCGLILSAMYIFFRDTQYLYNIFCLILTYLSAIFYPVDNYSPATQRAFLINPVYVYIKYFRIIVIDGNVPSLSYHLLCLFYAAIAISIGGLIYKRCNHRFLYYV